MSVFHESAQFINRLESAFEEKRNNWNLLLLRVQLDLVERCECAVSVTERESVERLALRHSLIDDAMHTVNVLAIEIDIRFPHFPSMVLLDHGHPLAGTRGGCAACVHFAGMKERISAIELFSNHHGFANKPARV